MTTRILVQSSSMPVRASVIALATASLLASFAQTPDRMAVAAQEMARKAQSLQFDSARIAEEAARQAQNFQFDSAGLAEASRAAVAESLAQLSQDSRLQLDKAFTVLGETSTYESGISALDSERWQSAVDAFSRVIKSGKTRVDGALYWKAYALNRLGQRPEAQATLQELFKGHPNSRYLDDARALEIDLKQGSGQNVKPEDQANDELKAIAFSALMRSDPERAIPMGQQLLQGRSSPRLKQQILFSLAMSATPKAQDVVAAIARGGQGVNPDVQMKAIKYLGAYGRNNNNTALLGDVYNSTKDPDVRRQIIRSLGSARDDKQLIALAKSETTPELRIEAIRQLGSMMSGSWVLGGNFVVTPPVVVSGSGSGGGVGGGVGSGSGFGQSVRVEALRATSRERPKVDSAAISEALVQIYRTDKDLGVKRAIVSALGSAQNAKALVDLARAEPSPELKRDIVSRLSSMKSKEATDYLMELLK